MHWVQLFTCTILGVNFSRVQIIEKWKWTKIPKLGHCIVCLRPKYQIYPINLVSSRMMRKVHEVQSEHLCSCLGRICNKCRLWSIGFKCWTGMCGYRCLLIPQVPGSHLCSITQSHFRRVYNQGISQILIQCTRGFGLPNLFQKSTSNHHCTFIKGWFNWKTPFSRGSRWDLYQYWRAF